nr:RecName: Full=Uncharacterized protein IMPP11 [Nautilus macromphalus]
NSTMDSLLQLGR